jgi:hypothetical protein
MVWVPALALSTSIGSFPEVLVDLGAVDVAAVRVWDVPLGAVGDVPTVRVAVAGGSIPELGAGPIIGLGLKGVICNVCGPVLPPVLEPPAAVVCSWNTFFTIVDFVISLRAPRCFFTGSFLVVPLLLFLEGCFAPFFPILLC